LFLTISKRRRKVIADRIHRAALAAVVEYARDRLTSVHAHPRMLPAEAQGILHTVWGIYLVALRMAYGELPGSVNEIVSERLQEVLSQVRKVLDQQLKRPRNKKYLIFPFDDLRNAEESASSLARDFSSKLSTAPRGGTTEIPGAVSLLLGTDPTVLMRRAVIAQLLADRPYCTQKDMCGRLDYHNCPIPQKWQETVADWKASYQSLNFQRRVKKLLSDDVDELRKWGAVTSKHR
jgi:hypothetical protein